MTIDPLLWSPRDRIRRADKRDIEQEERKTDQTMPIFANEFPSGFQPGSDFVQIDDEEFSLASEPGGLIAIAIETHSGYLTTAAAKRLLAALTVAVANSEAAMENGI